MALEEMQRGNYSTSSKEDGRSLAEKLESFSHFPQFWEEEEEADPNTRKEVEEFRMRLEEAHRDFTQSRKSFESFNKLRDMCLDMRSAINSRRSLSQTSPISTTAGTSIRSLE